MIPLILKLKKERHKKVAVAQDIVISELYKVFENAVLHGGTAIWRCYEGNRFSEDIDVYIPRDIKKINLLFENFAKAGFVIKKKKIGENSLFSNLGFGGTEVRFEVLFKKSGGILKEYETTNGNLIMIYTLMPEKLIKEKIDTYIKRFKVRDLYDVFFLLKYIEDKNKIKKELRALIKNFKKPVDKNELRVLIIEGLVPDIKKMIEYVGRGL